MARDPFLWCFLQIMCAILSPNSTPVLVKPWEHKKLSKGMQKWHMQFGKKQQKDI